MFRQTPLRTHKGYGTLLYFTGYRPDVTQLDEQRRRYKFLSYFSSGPFVRSLTSNERNIEDVFSLRKNFIKLRFVKFR